MQNAKQRLPVKHQIRFNEPMGSIISNEEAQCRNVDNMSVYEYRRQANVAAMNAQDCYSRDGGIMTVSGGASDRVPPSRLIDVETQIRRGANTVTSCRLYRPEAALRSENFIRKAMAQPQATSPACTGSIASVQTGIRRDEFPEYTYFQPFTDGLPPLPSGTILPGIDTRRELKDAWKQRNPKKPSETAAVAFTPGTWLGPFGGPPSTIPKSTTVPFSGLAVNAMGKKPYGELLQDLWRQNGCKILDKI